MGTFTWLAIFATLVAISSAQIGSRYSNQDAVGVPQGAVYGGGGPGLRTRPRLRSETANAPQRPQANPDSSDETPVQRLRRPITRRLLRPRPTQSAQIQQTPAPQGPAIPSRALPRRPVIPGAVPGAVPLQSQERVLTIPERRPANPSPQAIKPVVEEEDEYDDEEPQQDGIIGPQIPLDIPIPPGAHALPFRPQTTIAAIQPSPSPYAVPQPVPRPVQPIISPQPQIVPRPTQPVRSRPQNQVKKVPSGYDDDVRGQQRQQFQQQPVRSQPRQQVRQQIRNEEAVPYVKSQRVKKPVAQIIKKYRYDNDDGSITWGFENDDGTFKEETIGVDCVVRGKYGYTDPDGVKREYTYISGNPCDKKEEEQKDEGYLDYENNKYVFPNGDAIDLQTVVKNRARRPTGK